MSVLVSSIKSYELVFVKAVDYTFRKTCDINYCSVLGGLTEGQIASYVRIWANLNNQSYLIRYKEPKDEVPYSTFLNLRYSGKTINTYQMLKTLECICYNIEVDTIKTVGMLTVHESAAMDVLNRAIDEIKSVIINEIKEYKDAQWCIE
jgi:hypothetical protein